MKSARNALAFFFLSKGVFRLKKHCKCVECGKDFTSYNPSPKYCSIKCRDNNKRISVPTTKMIELYEKGFTQEEVAKYLGTTQKVIYKRMKEIGYKPRVAAKRNQTGINNDSWKGGKSKHAAGYVLIKTPDHPRASKCGEYVFEHILVVEKIIGRYLAPHEIVHHINSTRDDNRPENLYLTNLSEHSSMHNNGWASKVISNLQKFKEVK